MKNTKGSIVRCSEIACRDHHGLKCWWWRCRQAGGGRVPTTEVNCNMREGVGMQGYSWHFSPYGTSQKIPSAAFFFATNFEWNFNFQQL